jgi:hypothetical protein
MYPIQTAESFCLTDENCLGSFCDKNYQPFTCSPKTRKQVLGTGAYYNALG